MCSAPAFKLSWTWQLVSCRRAPCFSMSCSCSLNATPPLSVYAVVSAMPRMCWKQTCCVCLQLAELMLTEDRKIWSKYFWAAARKSPSGAVETALERLSYQACVDVCTRHALVSDPTVPLLRKLCRLPIYLHAAACRLGQIVSPGHYNMHCLRVGVDRADDIKGLPRLLDALRVLYDDLFDWKCLQRNNPTAPEDVFEVDISLHADIWADAHVVHAVRCFIQQARRSDVLVTCGALKVHACSAAADVTDDSACSCCKHSAPQFGSRNEPPTLWQQLDMQRQSGALQRLLTVFPGGADFTDLNGWRYGPLKVLDIGGCTLQPHVYNVFMELLVACGSKLEQLVLPQAWFYSEGHIPASAHVRQYLGQLTELRMLDASGVCFDDVSWGHIADALTSLTHLEHATLNGKGFGERNVMLAGDMAQPLQSVRIVDSLSLELDCVQHLDIDLGAAVLQPLEAFTFSNIRYMPLAHLAITAPMLILQEVLDDVADSAYTLSGLKVLRMTATDVLPLVTERSCTTPFSNLTCLSLQHVKLDSLRWLAQRLQGCKQLKKLELRDCLANGAVDELEDLGAMLQGQQHLELLEAAELDIDDAQLEMLIPAVAQLDSLRMIDLDGNAKLSNRSIRKLLVRLAQGPSAPAIRLDASKCLMTAGCSDQLQKLVLSDAWAAKVEAMCQW